MKRPSVKATGGAVVLSLIVVAGILVLSGRDDDHPPSGGIQIVHSFGGGIFTSLPGELHGIGALKIVAPPGERGTVTGWRFRVVEPSVPVRYLLRPFPTPAASSCPGGHIGFGDDAALAKERGENFPCDGFREAAGAPLSGRVSWELVAVFRAPPRGGRTVRFADPVVELRTSGGDPREVRTRYSQVMCVIGAPKCERVLRADGFDAADARRAIREDCSAPRRPPLFAPPAFTPAKDPLTERSRDDRGRLCSEVS